MLERIIVGILIGFVSGVAFTRSYENNEQAKNIVLGFICLVVVAFLGSSFMFGAIYGVMAIGEIAAGYWVSNSIFSKQKT
tara:strand:+ start:477 stop:716 length:240 start_codon:yes stop_codon:yes gene_type:complete